MPVRSPQKKTDGNHILYHYLQKKLQTSDVWLLQMLAARLVTDLGIWIHPDTYSAIPILLPFVVRDPRCRKGVSGLEAWGAPNNDGYFRDDNSMIKGLIRQLKVSQSASSLFAGLALGNGFTACHVWRRCDDSDSLASRDPRLNSFIPNLVWLPAQVAKLTDREESFVQTYLQALSWKIFRHSKIRDGVGQYAEEAWSLLRCPTEIPEDGLPDVENLNFFEHSDKFIRKREQKIRSVISLLDATILGTGFKGTNRPASKGPPSLGTHLKGMVSRIQYLT